MALFDCTLTSAFGLLRKSWNIIVTPRYAALASDSLGDRAIDKGRVVVCGPPPEPIRSMTASGRPVRMATDRNKSSRARFKAEFY